MNNRSYNSNTFFNYRDSLYPSQDLQNEFSNAMIEAMLEANNGNGIQYYDSSFSPKYQNGFANNEYWDVVGLYDFKLKSGRKPSDAISAFFTGTTLADCGSTISACQLKALLKVLGTEKFDAIFSDPNHPLVITESINATSEGIRNFASNFFNTENLNGSSNIGRIGHRPIQKGEACQIWGPPYYGQKHPGGFGRLENVICAGKNEQGEDLFIGFGNCFKNGPLTEAQIIQVLINEYNKDRDGLDMKIINSSSNPSYYDLKKNHLKEKLTPEEGLRESIGFMPNIKVSPAFEEIKKYQNLQLGNTNRFSSNANNFFEEPKSKPESVLPTYNNSGSSTYTNNPESNTYTEAEENSSERKHHFFRHHFFRHHFERRHDDEGGHFFRRFRR